MKKIRLSIDSPCTENWDGMTAQENGRFCASCRKTVVDFTGMSDRQLLEYFSGSHKNICGRLFRDQLDRELIPPPKSLPWFLYLLKLGWPALMFFLKSCTGRENNQGKLKIEETRPLMTAPPVVGNLIYPEDATNLSRGFVMQRTVPEVHPTQGFVTLVENQPKENDDPDKDGLTEDVELKNLRVRNTIPAGELPNADIGIGKETELEPVEVTAYVYQHKMVMMGGISSVNVCRLNQQDTGAKQSGTQKSTVSCRVFPNPVSRGSLLTVSFEEPDDMPGLVQLISSSGQEILSEKLQEDHALVFNLRIPAGLSSGFYFLRLVNKDGKSGSTEKIIVD